MLILEGGDGSGKTYMLVNILRELQKMEPPTLGAYHVCIASYMHEMAPGGSSSSASKDPAGRSRTAELFDAVSRSILWQCAVSYEPFTKSVAAICECLRGSFDSAMEMWAQTVVENPDVQKLGMVFFVLLDGLDEYEDFLTKLLPWLSVPASPGDTTETRSCIRVLLTVKSDAPRASAGPDGEAEQQATPPVEDEGDERSGSHASVPVIRMGPPRNTRDVELYISSRLDRMDIFRDASSRGAAIAAWRTRILTTLRDRTAGDYFKLVTNLDAIEKLDIVEDVEAVLRDAGKTRADQIEAEISRLDAARTPKEIAEINELVLWISTAAVPLTVQEEEAVLALRQEHAYHHAQYHNHETTHPVGDNVSSPGLTGTKNWGTEARRWSYQVAGRP